MTRRARPAPWRPLLSISGSEAAYAARNSDGITGQRVIEFMVRERANSNAIRSCLRLARDNARVVRDRISKEMWEVMNELWLRSEPSLTSPMSPERTAPFCRFVRGEVARFHGVTVSTMMRGEAFGFYHLGTFVERADMTARILDVKYHLLLPEVEPDRLRARLLPVGGAAEIAVGVRGVSAGAPDGTAPARRGAVRRAGR